MATPVTLIQEYYNDFIDQHGDPRTRDWVMVRNPVPSLCLIALYLIFVKYIGPRLMENRKPFQLNKAMIIYNGLQSAISLTLFVLGSAYGWFTRYSWTCQPLIVDHPDEMMILKLGWIFYMVRFFEFTDTIFFILRKKYNQISTLHVIHHSLVPMIFWMGLMFAPAGQYSLAAYLNAIVHFFMYSYYMLTAMGPQYKKLLWWKKYMTTMQLVQFVIVLIHTVYSIFSSCEVNKVFGYVILFQAAMFLFMFYNFYNAAFIKTEKTPTKSMEHVQNGHSNGIIHEPENIGVINKKTKIH